MVISVKLIGMYIAVIGAVIALKPDIAKQVVAFIVQGKRLYLAGILRVCIGGILLLASPQCRLPGVVGVIGAIAVMGGIFFIIGLEKVKAIINWWNRLSHLVKRVWGLVALVVGALLIYSA